MDTIATMQLFGVVAKLGSFSAAGRMLGMAPSSVSRRIDALETALGAQLINRTSRRLTLTDVGMLYHQRSSAILGEVQNLNENIADFQNSPKGILHVHTRLRIGLDFLKPSLPDFLAQYPDLRVKLWLDEEWHDLIANEIDIAIRIGNITEPSLTVTKLFEAQGRILIASPEYLKGRPEIHQPEDLQQHNCLTWDTNGRTLYDHQHWHFRNAERALSVRVAGNLFVNNADVLKDAVLAGVGIALQPAWVVAPEVKEGKIIRILPEYEATPTVFDHSLYAVFHSPVHMPRKVRVFLDYYKDYFRRRGRELEGLDD